MTPRKPLLNVGAIRGIRLWGKGEFLQAIFDNAVLELRALLLELSSSFARAQVEEHPEAYDQDMMDSALFKFDSYPGSLYHVFAEHFERI